MGPEGAVNIVFRQELAGGGRPGGAPGRADRRLPGALREPLLGGGARLRRRRDRAATNPPVPDPRARDAPRQARAGAEAKARQHPAVTDRPATQSRSTAPGMRESVFPIGGAWEAELEAAARRPAAADAVPRTARRRARRSRSRRSRPATIWRDGRVASWPTRCSAMPSRPPIQAAVARFGRAQAAEAQLAAAASFVEPELLGLGRERLPSGARRDPALVALRALLRRPRSGAPGTALGGGRGGARALVRRLLRPVRDLQRVRRQRLAFARPRGGDGDRGGGDAGHRSTRFSATPTGAAAERLGELRGRLSRRPQRARRELASTIKQAVFSARVRRHESSLGSRALAVERPARGLRQPARDFEANLPTWHRYWRLRRSIQRRRAARSRTTSRRRSARPRRSLEYEQCVEWICAVARAARRRVRRHGAARLPRGALGRRLSDGREDGRRLLRRLAGDGSVHRDELRRDGRQSRDARP